jgi:hypothetical protein
MNILPPGLEPVVTRSRLGYQKYRFGFLCLRPRTFRVSSGRCLLLVFADELHANRISEVNIPPSKIEVA